MTQNWIKIYETESTFAAEVLKQGLEENGIPAVIIDKKVSLYNIGLVTVLVSPETAESAKLYLSENEIK
ncbi:MAG: DUF2007 domain-containing protein [Sphingobacteriaceae bacterium]|nr:DUF2007 domain-containing protein [Sphingobacteriaceae bacterium]